jgi:hypothetical protein
MKISLKHYVVGLIGNLLVVAVGVIGIVQLFLDPAIVDKTTAFNYFTVLSNVFVIAVSLLMVCLHIATLAKKRNYVKEGFQVLKLMSVAGVAITFTIVLIYLYPADPTYGWFSGSQLFLHAILPLTAIFSFIFLEYATKIRFRFFFLPVVLIILYGAFYIPYAFFAPEGTLVDWYGFVFGTGTHIAPVDRSLFNVQSFLIFLAESLGAALVYGFLLWLLNKIINLIFVGYVMEEEEYYDEVASPEEIKEEEAKEVAPAEETPVEEVEEKKTTSSKKKVAASKSKVSAPKKYKDGARVYHISRSKFVSRSWQVKLAGGEKAIKIFPTQAEAINFAKGLVRSQGGSIRIHSMKGQLRK